MKFLVAAVLAVLMSAGISTVASAVEGENIPPPPPQECVGSFCATPVLPMVEIQQPDVQFDQGWITATIYFNRGETNLLANYLWFSGVVCAMVAGAYGWVAGLVCSVFGPSRMMWYATIARSHGNCLGIRWVQPFGIVTPLQLIYWSIEHNGSRCY